jgi:2-oxoglutarate dehydrogenase E2 component (dihydrolipoamide succinyltransferase)
MKNDVNVPSVGESITSGVLVSWLKHNGDKVKEGENIFELETDKAVLEIPSPGDGTLETLVDEGTEVSIGQTVATLSTVHAEAKTADTKEAQAEAEEKHDTPVSPASQNQDVATPKPDTQTAQKSEPTAVTAGDKEPAAQEQKEAPGQPPDEISEHQPVSGTSTVQTKAKEQAPSPVPPAEAPKEQLSTEQRTKRVPMSTIRRKTAERLVQAKQTTAYLTTFNEIDMQKVIEIRTQYKELFQKEHGIRIGFMSFFVKACCQALKDFPSINTQLDGNDIIYKYFYDIGVAMSVERGLIVPVIRDADKKHFAEIETKIASMAQRAREKKLMPDELAGGTFTITNGGVFGSLLSTPLPAYPQTAILGMHAIKKRPVVIDGQITIRPMMYVALTYDHRVIDGREAVSFLARLKEFIENPDKLLLEL